MPRKSLKASRSEKILNAYADCIVRYGLEGATQEKIAEHAGVKRSILRHYLGNKADMLNALINHVTSKFDSQVQSFADELPTTNRLDTCLEWMFDSEYSSDKNATLALEALTVCAYEHPYAREKLMDSTKQFIWLIENELIREFPNASSDRTFDAAIGITGIYFSIDSLTALQPPDEWWSASKRAAHMIVHSLGAS